MLLRTLCNVVSFQTTWSCLHVTAQLDSVIKLLPRLQYGLDVNVQFNNVRGFEFTEEMAAFDMSSITLLHGWIVDPEDRQTVINTNNYTNEPYPIDVE